MAGSFDAKLLISTKEAETNLKNTETAARALDAALKSLDGTSKDVSKNVAGIASAMAGVVQMERDAAAAVKERAAATLAASKADAQAIANQTKVAESASRVAVNEAKIGTESAKTTAIVTKSETDKAAKLNTTTAAIDRNNKATDASIERAGKLNDAKVNNTNNAGVNALVESNGRLAVSEQRAATAALGTEQAQLRLNNAQGRSAKSTLELNDNLSNSRYLLYDVGATYRALSLSMLAIPAATTAVAASYEKDFAQVLRTTTGQSSADVLKLRDDLKTLGSQIPLTFGELSNIASLGAQLGLGATQLASFTDAVGKFVATTNVGVEDATTAFGRLKSAFNDQYEADPANFFRKIGSAISELGTSSVATDSEIVAVMNQISPLGNIAGFTAQEVAGLSSALASVRIRPEMARGSFQRIMSGITASADQGSVAMERYANFMGVTGQQALAMQKADPAKFFTDLVTGMGKSLDAGVPFTKVLDDIGVKSVRDKQFVLALANNHTVLADSMDLANKSYAEGSYLDKSSGEVFKTLAASLKMLATDFANLGDAVGGATLGMISDFIRLISGAASGITDFVQANKGVGAAISTFMGISAIVGAALAVKSAMAFALAGMVAFQQVAGKVGISTGMTASGGMRQMGITLLMLKGASREAATALVQQNGATRALGATSAQLAAANEAVAASLTAEAVAARAAGGAQAQLAATTAATTLTGSRMGGVFRTVGSGLLSLAGGPIGIAIGAVALLGGALFSAAQKADQAGKSIATAMAQGADAGSEAIAQSLTDLKVGFLSNTDSRFTDLGKNMRELGDQAGVSMDKMVAAVKKGKGAGEELTKTLDEIAKSKGFDNFKQWDDSNSTVFDTQLSNLRDIKRAVEAQGSSYVKNKADLDAVTTATKDATPAMKALGSAAKVTGDTFAEQSDQIDKLSDAIKGAVEEAFGFINLQGAVQASLQKLGESLQKGGNDFSVYSEAGRDNLDALEKVFSTQGEKLGNDVANMLITPDQAASQYSAYVNDVLSQLAAKGVDTSKLAGLATDVKSAFQSNLSLGDAAQIPVGVKVDPAKVAEAQTYLEQVSNEFGTIDVTVLTQMQGGDAVVAQVNAMQGVIQDATGKPYVAKVGADTSAANDNVVKTGDFLLDLVLRAWVLPVEADTNPAVKALQGLAQFAAAVMNSLIDKINKVASVAANIPGMGWAKNIQLGHVGWGEIPTPAAAVAAPRAVDLPKAPTQTPVSGAGGQGNSSAIPKTSTDGLAKGYDNAAKAADKAGAAGAKAGKDMANGINDATKAVNDYASRLKTGLQSAFDKQYGLQVATDAYHSALNAVVKKREDDLKSIQDLIDKQKELNNAKNADLIDARKAGIEKNISIKYGETDRAADYGNQQKTALDNAAAKQKDIDANTKAKKSLEDGMGALTGYSDAAIANRAALRDLESKMTDMIVAYANTGKSQGQVATYAADLTKQFGVQVGQLGFNVTAVGSLQGAMGRYIAVVNAVPERVNTAVSTSGTNSGGASGGGAVGDLGGVAAAIADIPKKSRVDVGVQITYLDVLDPYGALKGYREVKNGKTQMGVQLIGGYTGGQVRGYADGGMIAGKAPSNPRADNLLASVDGKGLIKVRSQEFIMSQPAVDYWGSDFMHAINNMNKPAFNMGGSPGGGSAGGSGGGGGVQVVELTAENLALIAQLANTPTVLKVDGRELASTVNAGNKILASEGRN